MVLLEWYDPCNDYYLYYLYKLLMPTALLASSYYAVIFVWKLKAVLSCSYTTCEWTSLEACVYINYMHHLLVL